jgi:hypothetical protein
VGHEHLFGRWEESTGGKRPQKRLNMHLTVLRENLFNIFNSYKYGDTPQVDDGKNYR